jgi:hypothetical protein
MQPHLSTPPFPADWVRASLLRLWRIPGLNTALKRSLRFAPRRLREYAERQRAAVKLRERRRAIPERGYRTLLRRGLETLRAHGSPLGDYLEFGVYNGTSLISTYRETETLALTGMRLFGFDSFQGLPPAAAWEDDGTWRPGAWRSELAFTEAVLATEGVDRTRVTLVPGWFSDTCTPETAARLGIRHASVIMIDCDIYSSTKEALAFCAPLIGDRALMLFDDWHSGNLAARNKGERRAFEEWLAATGCFSAEPFGAYSRNSETFVLTRTRAA